MDSKYYLFRTLNMKSGGSYLILCTLVGSWQ